MVTLSPGGRMRPHSARALDAWRHHIRAHTCCEVPPQRPPTLPLIISAENELCKRNCTSVTFRERVLASELDHPLQVARSLTFAQGHMK